MVSLYPILSAPSQFRVRPAVPVEPDEDDLPGVPGLVHQRGVPLPQRQVRLRPTAILRGQGTPEEGVGLGSRHRRTGTPQIESRVYVCPRQNLCYLQHYPIFKTIFM